jgi:hypothetical protein
MAKETASKFDFLTDYALALLEEHGVQLSDEQKSTYVPELLAEVEQRLGAALIPKLSDEQLASLDDLLQTEDTTPETWERFWRDALGTFEEDVKEVLRDFALEVKDLLAA